MAMNLANAFIGVGAILIGLFAFTNPPSPDYRSALLTFGSMMLGIAIGRMQSATAHPRRESDG